MFIMVLDLREMWELHVCDDLALFLSVESRLGRVGSKIR